MSQARRLRLPARVRAKLDRVAGSGAERARWLRERWARYAARENALEPDPPHEEIRVKLPDSLLDDMRQAADEAGMHLETWMRRVVEICLARR